MYRCLLSVAAVFAFAASAVAAPKNVVLLIADDLGLEVGCYGDASARTPHIDALANSGTRFSLGFASVSSCSCSRASILTGMPTHMSGQYGLAHGTHNVYSFRNVKGLPATSLAPYGYRSGVIAKLHVQPKEVYPFDVEIPGSGRNPVQIAEQAKKFILDSGDKPFFLLGGASLTRTGLSKDSPTTARSAGSPSRPLRPQDAAIAVFPSRPARCPGRPGRLLSVGRPAG